MTKPAYIGYNRRTGEPYVRIKETSGGLLRVWGEDDRDSTTVEPDDIILYEDSAIEPDNRGGARTPKLKELEKLLKEPRPIGLKPHKVLDDQPLMTLDYLLGEISDLRVRHPDFQIILEIRSRESAL